MTLESGTWFSDYHTDGGNIDRPEDNSDVGELDDHNRFIKSAEKAHFANLTGAVTSTHTELNYLDGLSQHLKTIISGQSGAGLAVAAGDAADPTVYTLTTGQSITVADGQRFTFQVDKANVNACQLKIDSSTARNIVDKNGDTLATGDIPINAVIDVVYDASATQFYVIGGLYDSASPSFSQLTALTSNGTHNVGVGVTKVKVIAIGGGGGGARDLTFSGGGGGGGGYIETVLPVRPSDSITIVVGSGGAGVTGASGGDGGDSTYTFDGKTYTAEGGSGASTVTGGAAGSGSTPSGGYPSTTKSGGAGGNSASSSSSGGGGGSGAGLSGSGSAGATGAAGGAGGTGSGGAAGGTSGGNGTNATIPVTTSDINSGGGGGGTSGDAGDGGSYGSGGGGTVSGTGGDGSGGIVVVLY